MSAQYPAGVLALEKANKFVTAACMAPRSLDSGSPCSCRVDAWRGVRHIHRESGVRHVCVSLTCSGLPLLTVDTPAWLLEVRHCHRRRSRRRSTSHSSTPIVQHGAEVTDLLCCQRLDSHDQSVLTSYSIAAIGPKTHVGQIIPSSTLQAMKIKNELQALIKISSFDMNLVVWLLEIGWR